MRQLIIGLADFMRNLLVARTPETMQLFPYTDCLLYTSLARSFCVRLSIMLLVLQHLMAGFVVLM